MTPEILGIQNEVTQSAADWKKMASALRRGLDAAGFAATKIHTHNPPTSVGGVAAAGAFREDPASNLYDYQSLFHDPDGYETRLADLRAASGEKPFLAVELCVINGDFQTRGYRVAFAMGQLYHKLPTQLNVGAALYCRTPLNVEQPSYGWTRTLFAPDAEHGMKPVASDHQLRILGAYTRRVREGMKRVKAASSHIRTCRRRRSRVRAARRSTIGRRRAPSGRTRWRRCPEGPAGVWKCGWRRVPSLH